MMNPLEYFSELISDLVFQLQSTFWTLDFSLTGEEKLHSILQPGTITLFIVITDESTIMIVFTIDESAIMPQEFHIPNLSRH